MSLLNDIEKSCLQYFKSSPVWRRIFDEFREKYRSYGYFTGNVKLRNVSPDEIEVLEGFFGKNFHGQKSISISAARFVKALNSGRYAEISPEHIISLYFDDVLKGKKEELEEEERVRAEVMEEWKCRFEGTPAAESHAAAYIQEILSTARHEIIRWEYLMALCANVFNQLPYRNGEKLYLAVFATYITGDPHAFDAGSTEGNLLNKLIDYDLKLRGIKLTDSGLFPAYRRQRSYLEVGIMIDDVSNYVMLYGVNAVKKNGKRHKGMEGFADEHNMIQVPLAVLTDWERIECSSGNMYIFENPSVYAIMCAKDGIRSHAPGASYMCMNGQPRLAGLIALELLSRSETTVYYSGDLDPEGLLIAQKLSEFYNGKFILWHMGTEDYEASRSNEEISARRLKMLEKINDERLVPSARMIMKYKKAGYQERINFDL